MGGEGWGVRGGEGRSGEMMGGDVRGVEIRRVEVRLLPSCRGGQVRVEQWCQSNH